jgi:hypothetical protein
MEMSNLMRTLRVIFLAGLIFALAGSAFAGNNQDGNSQGGKTYTAPEFDFHGPLKYELLVVAGGAVLLLERRRRRRRAALNK